MQNGEKERDQEKEKEKEKEEWLHNEGRVGRTNLQVKGKTTFKEEFVTCGGIKLNEVDANTMQSKRVPGLYFCGEVLDIDGITGGFNFQQSWSGGWISAQSISQEDEKKCH